MAVTNLKLMVLVIVVLLCGCIGDDAASGRQRGAGEPVQPIPSTAIGKTSGSELKSVCEKLPEGENTALCLGLVNNDSGACGALESQAGRDDCYARMGDYILDPAICEKIVADAPHDRCVDVIGFESGNPDLCTKCRNKFDNILCRALAGKDAGLCEQLLIPDRRILCKAYASGNPTLCDTIQEKALKDDCQIVFAIQRRDKSLCANIGDSNTKALCSTIVQKDKPACEQIPQEEYRIRCNAVVEDDPSICDQIKNPEQRPNCLINYVEARLNYYD